MAARHEPELETAVYRIVQEAINNAVKHSGSEKIHVTVVDAEDVVSVTVRDEGRGFDPGVHAVPQAEAADGGAGEARTPDSRSGASSSRR